MRNFQIIVWTVWIEYLRRKDFYVVLILTALFALAALITRTLGVRTADEAYFLMSFGLTLAYLLAGIMTVMLASRQIQREFERKTLYPIVARPITRITFLSGKLAGVSGIGILSLLLLSMLAWLPTPKSTEQHWATLIQVLGMESLSLVLLAAVTCAFSMHLPPIVSALLSLGLFLGGGTLLSLIRHPLRKLPPVVFETIDRLLLLIPDFSVFEHIPRFVEGEGPINALSLIAVAAYGTLLILLYSCWAGWTLSRRQL